MENKNDIAMMPFYAHESAMARMERTQKRLIYALMSSVIMNILIIVFSIIWK